MEIIFLTAVSILVLAMFIVYGAIHVACCLDIIDGNYGIFGGLFAILIIGAGDFVIFYMIRDLVIKYIL